MFTDKQSKIKFLYERKEFWEKQIIAQEKTINLNCEFFDDAELKARFAKLAQTRDNLDNINEELQSILFQDIEK